jgi:hypothetical protein
MNHRFRDEDYRSRRVLRFHRPPVLAILVLISFLLFTSIVNAESSFSSSSSLNATTVYATKTLTEIPLTLTTTTTAISASSSMSGSATTLITAVNTAPVTIPQPFDTAQLSGNGTNFTTSTCPQYMRSFLSDPSFKACVPFSLLLYTSAQFISITRDVLP